MEVDITTCSILDLIPHRPPVVCVDRLLEVTDSAATSSFLIRPDFIFVEHGKITASGLLENAAQTAAARAGYFYQLADHPVQMGYIGALRHVNVYELPSIDDSLRTTVTIQKKIVNMLIAAAVIHCDEKLILDCELRIIVEK